MITTKDIAQMSKEEKVFLLEAIWEDLSKSDVNAPVWHEQALKDTEVRLAQGSEKIVDWKEAKEQLRSKFA